MRLPLKRHVLPSGHCTSFPPVDIASASVTVSYIFMSVYPPRREHADAQGLCIYCPVYWLLDAAQDQRRHGRRTLIP